MNLARVILGVALALSGGALSACNTQCDAALSFGQVVQRWDFEGCSDSLCGWAVERGSVTREALFHPGEHGMAIASGASATVPLNITSLNRFGEPMSLDLIAYCDPDTGLVATLDGVLSAEQDAGTVSREGSTQSGTILGTNWVSVAAVFSQRTDSATRLHLATVGPGRCLVDQIKLKDGMSFGGFCG